MYTTAVHTSVFHKKLLLKEATPLQNDLYASGLLGFSGDGEQDVEKLTAVFVLGIHKTFEGLTNRFQNVTFAIPRAHDAWAVSVMNDQLKQALAEHRSVSKPDSYKKLKTTLHQALTNLSIGGRVINIDEPTVWVGYGFPKSPPTPEWLSKKLI